MAAPPAPASPSSLPWSTSGAAGAVRDVLLAARDHGFLGPGPVEAHLEHARGFLEAWTGAPPDRALDLGSGAGLPGLPLAMAWPRSRWMLVETNERRAAFLREAVESLGLEARATVAHGRAEALGRDPTLRGQIALVVARSFGPPAVTAECAAPFLRLGGRLLVSEPPVAERQRWPAEGLASLGLTSGGRTTTGTSHVQVLVQAAPCPDRYPRRVGVPAKRPLF